jgi:DNA-binding NarL/FixJ family response regulator
VYVYAKDGVLRAGVASQLRNSPQIVMADEYGIDKTGVAVMAADEATDDVLAAIRAVRRTCTPRILVVITRVTRTAGQALLNAGACSLIRRSEARPDRLVSAVRKLVDPDRDPVPTDVDDLIDVFDEEPEAPVAKPAIVNSALNDRDLEVLRLVADGHSTTKIANDLAYSESTIKNIIHATVHELGARNRAHAVALAVRANLI